MNDLLQVLFYYNFVDKNEVSGKFKIVCPFHGDVNASLLADIENNKFYCFGCEARGDALKFISLMEKCNDLKALQVFNKITKANTKSDIKIFHEEIKTDEQWLFEAKRYFYSLPKTDWRQYPKSYLCTRGFLPETLNKHDVRINYSRDYDVILPMSENGIFKGYVCRTSDKEVEQKRKYLYNKGFSRRTNVIGNFYKDWVFITEGFLDLLKFKQYGVNNSVAILGWKITDQQIEKILSSTKNVVSALDNTKTGREGTQYLRKYFNVIRFSFFDNVKDIGDLTQIQFNKLHNDTREKILKNKG